MLVHHELSLDPERPVDLPDRVLEPPEAFLLLGDDEVPPRRRLDAGDEQPEVVTAPAVDHDVREPLRRLQQRLHALLRVVSGRQRVPNRRQNPQVPLPDQMRVELPRRHAAARQVGPHGVQRVPLPVQDEVIAVLSRPEDHQHLPRMALRQELRRRLRDHRAPDPVVPAAERDHLSHLFLLSFFHCLNCRLFIIRFIRCSYTFRPSSVRADHHAAVFRRLLADCFRLRCRHGRTERPVFRRPGQDPGFSDFFAAAEDVNPIPRP